MRRSTAAAVGTLTGAALIVGVRLSVASQVPVAAAAPPVQAPAASAEKPAEKPAGKRPAAQTGGEAGADESAAQGKFKNGTYQASAKYVYGSIDVTLKVTGGKISAVEVAYPTANDSGTINPPAVAQLRQETLQAQDPKDVQAVSGATLTSAAYLKSLQAAIDQAA